MPAVSGAQYRLMQAALHGASDKVPKDVAREFISKTPAKKRKKFAKKGRK
jgi:hypothetical protein